MNRGQSEFVVLAADAVLAAEAELLEITSGFWLRGRPTRGGPQPLPLLRPERMEEKTSRITKYEI